MAYQAIYRKWRPLTFEDVVGQTHITDTLKTELITNRVAHAYLFCGTRGTGKTSTAKILSRAINCENQLNNGNPCNECASCRGILSGSIMDVVEIDAASNNGVDNIRDLRDEIAYTPANVKFKIYIIDEVHMLSPGAFNALLKTLEEPPSHAVFILATTEPHKIPATIQSRCQRFDFRMISAHHIAGRIGEITRKDNINITQDAIRLVAELGDGSMRDALSILDLCSGITGEITHEDIENVAGIVGKTVLHSIASALTHKNTSDAIILVNKMIVMGRDVLNLLDELLAYFREILICKIMDNPEEVLDKASEDLLLSKDLASSTSNEAILHTIRLLADTVSVCKYSTNPRIMLEATLVKICNPQLDSTSEAFAVRLKNIEDGIVVGNVTPVPVNTYVPEPVIETTQPVMETTQPVMETVSEEIPQPTISITDTLKWESIVDSISVHSPGLCHLLQKTKGEFVNDTLYITFENEIFRDLVKTNQSLVDILIDVIGGRSLKLVTIDEQSKKKPIDVKDPLDEILDLDGQLEQMTIL